MDAEEFYKCKDPRINSITIQAFIQLKSSTVSKPERDDAAFNLGKYFPDLYFRECIDYLETHFRSCKDCTREFGELEVIAAIPSHIPPQKSIEQSIN